MYIIVGLIAVILIPATIAVVALAKASTRYGIKVSRNAEK